MQVRKSIYETLDVQPASLELCGPAAPGASCL